MELKLIRDTFSNTSSIGELFDGSWNFLFYTLEDKDRGLVQSMPLSQIVNIKIPHETCIPYGRYEVVISYSERFKRMLPLLVNVPAFEGVRIHNGNYSKDTDGCILIGTSWADDYVGNSVKAMNKFMPMLNKWMLSEKIFLNITK